MQNGINLSPVNYWTEQPFFNRIRAALVKPGNGQAIFGEFLAPGDSSGSTFELTWDGGGQVTFGPGCTQIVPQVPGRAVFKWDSPLPGSPHAGLAGQIMITQRSPGQTNFKLHKQGEIGDGIWRKEFIEDMRGFAFFRTMDFTATNASTRTNMKIADDGVGSSLEAIVDLANRTGMRPWVNLPHLISDAGLREAVEYLDKNCGPVPHLEFSNEMWNWSFAQTKYALTQNKNIHTWMGQQVLRLLDATKGTRVRVGMYGQIVQIGVFNQALAVLGPRASELEAIGGTTYVGSNFAPWLAPGRTRELLADNDIAGAHDDMRKYIPDTKKMYALWATKAKELGVKLWAYEGGQYHLNSRPYGDIAEPLRKFYYDVQTHPTLSAETLQMYYAAFEESGGDLQMVYNLTSGSTQDGFYGVKMQPIWEFLKAPKTPPALTVTLDDALKQAHGLVAMLEALRDALPAATS